MADPKTPDVSAPQDDDDKPDYVRMMLLASVLAVLLGFFVYTKFINPPKKPFYAVMPGVDLAGVAQPQVDEILKRANGQMCDCGIPGCTFNVAECRNLDPACDNSLKRAGEIVQAVTGKPPKLSMPSPAPSGAPSVNPHAGRH